MAKQAVFKDQRTLNAVISQRIFADIVRDPSQIKGSKGKKTLSGEFHEASQEIAVRVLKYAEPTFTASAKQAYIQALDELTKHFDAGFSTGENPYGWPQFSKKYASRKRTADKRRGRGRKTADKFWVKERGGVNGKFPSLTQGFKVFTKSYKQTIRNTKGVVKFHSHKKIYHGNRYRMSLDIIMPKPKVGGSYLTALLHDSFFKRVEYEFSRAKAASDMPQGLLKLAWLESGPVGVPEAAPRPFVSQMMADRGQELRQQMDNYMTALLKEASVRGLVGYN